MTNQIVSNWSKKRCLMSMWIEWNYFMKLVEKRKTRQGNFHHLLIDYSLSLAKTPQPPTHSKRIFIFTPLTQFFSFLNYRSLLFLILLFPRNAPLWTTKRPFTLPNHINTPPVFRNFKENLKAISHKVGKLSTFSRNSHWKPLISSSSSVRSPSKRTCLFNPTLVPLEAYKSMMSFIFEQFTNVPED